MAKQIQYPTNEWLDKYVDKHGCSLEDAECAWWDAQIDKGNPTPYDLTPEQEKESRKANRPRATKSVDAYGKERKRERKPNEDKRLLIDCLRDALQDFDDCVVTNPERQVDFTLNGIAYSVTLTAHRKPKEGKA